MVLLPFLVQMTNSLHPSDVDRVRHHLKLTFMKQFIRFSHSYSKATINAEIEIKKSLVKN